MVAEALAAAPKIRRASREDAARTLTASLAAGVSSATLFDDAGQFHTLPGQQPTDGFFAAILENE